MRSDKMWKLALGLNFVVINIPMLPVTEIWWLVLIRHIIISIGCFYIADGLKGD